jgi:hypothetical protein
LFSEIVTIPPSASKRAHPAPPSSAALEVVSLVNNPPFTLAKSKVEEVLPS